MITKDFYGTSFVWWMGRVEQIVNEPLLVGRARVRIFGLHSDDKVAVPTESLPWAQILLPTNGSTTFSMPEENSWVWGFFQDGKNSQIPVIMGVYSGVKGETYTELVPPDAPQPPADVVFRKENEPLNARQSWKKIEGTMIDKMNNDLTAVCDVQSYVKIATGKIKQASSTVIEEIKEAFRAFLASLGFDPSGGKMRAAFQELKEIIAKVKKDLKEFREELKFWKEEILDAINIIKEIINFIKNLPEKFRKFVSDCITKILNAVKNGLSDLKEYVGQDLGVDIDKVLAVVTTAFTKLNGITATLQSSFNSALQGAVPLPGGNRISNAILNPTKDTLRVATATFKSITDSLPTANEIATNTSFNTFSGTSPMTGP